MNLVLLLTTVSIYFSNLIFAAASSSPDWVSYLLNGGPFAVVVLLIILDKLTTPGERDKLRTENEQLRGEIKELNLSIKNEVIPPLIQVNSLMKDVIQEISISKDRARRG